MPGVCVAVVVGHFSVFSPKGLLMCKYPSELRTSLHNGRQVSSAIGLELLPLIASPYSKHKALSW